MPAAVSKQNMLTKSQIPIDHKNYSFGTYKNRYWVSDKFYQEGGPVFVYDVGEASGANAAQFHLSNSSSFFVEMLEEFGGMGVVWEHR